MIPCRSGAIFFNLNLTRFLCTHPRSACCGAFDQLSTGLFYLLGIGASFCGVGGFCCVCYNTVRFHGFWLDFGQKKVTEQMMMTNVMGILFLV